MELTDIQLEILKPFIDEMIESLDSMAGLKAKAGDPFQDKVEDFRFKGYAIASRTYGKVEGFILMHNYIETAVAIGNKVRFKLLGEEEEFSEINEDMQDALAEWGNTAVGRATKSLSEKNLGLKFDPPYFVLNTEDMSSLLKGVEKIISIPIHIEDVGRFYFNYLLY
ncbi:MAG: chemotaxis protein CheX [Proteobacteria bacterium]|nr:chemotaxis protein CheX [Pseudomonadota bacterium]